MNVQNSRPKPMEDSSPISLTEMSQQQPPRPQDEHQPIKYGNVFDVHGELEGRPVAPADASMMQAAESVVLGKTEKGAAASTMQSAAAKNEGAGFLGHNQGTDVAEVEGVAISETQLPGRRVITESVGDQVVGEYTTATPVAPRGAAEGEADAITIGEALEAAALSAGGKPVEWSDAAAVQVAEARAAGSTAMAAGGVGAAAQSAAIRNARTSRNEDKTKLADVLTDASEGLAGDKAVTRRDAERVAGAEARNDPKQTTYPGGVAAALMAAARLNMPSNKRDDHTD